ncbi:ARM repeat superfamily protein isoform X2 [Wolffia australiana]
MVEDSSWGSSWEGEILNTSSSSSSSTSSLGQALAEILSSRPRRIKAAVAELGPSPSKSSSGALLDESLCFVWRLVEDSARRNEPLDHLLVPLVERFHNQECRKQVFILIRWLCRNELLLQVILINLAALISSKSDHFTAFAWCIFVRNLVEMSSSRLFEEDQKGLHITVLRVLCRSIPNLLVVAQEGSILTEGFELPTRLAVAAADCIIVLTESLAIAESQPNKTSTMGPLPNRKGKMELIKFVSHSDCEGNIQDIAMDFSDGTRSEYLLWSCLNELIILVEKLETWSKKSLALREKGLKQVRKWLVQLREHYSLTRDEAGGESLKNGALLLSSCWRHYGRLLRLRQLKSPENPLQMLDEYLSALEFYAQHDTEGNPVKVQSSLETKKFFSNCIALLWGRLPVEERKSATSEIGIKIVTSMLSQLKSSDEDLVEMSVIILREIIFGSSSLFGGYNAEAHQFQDIFLLLLNLLNERDSTSKAVVLLVAEFCNLSKDESSIREVLKLLESGSHSQKRNAIDILVEIFRGQSDAKEKISSALWQQVASHLLECFEDEELVDYVKDSNLLPYIDPGCLLPQLIRQAYSGNVKLSSSSVSALTSVLSQHNDNFSVIDILLDSLSDLNKSYDSSLESGTLGQHLDNRSLPSSTGLKLDVDRVLKLTEGWIGNVKHFDNFIYMLMDKIFSEPSNPVLFRFMSYSSVRLLEAEDLVLHRILLQMLAQESDKKMVPHEMAESFVSNEAIKPEACLFSRLCPLLMIRLLPLKVFDNLGSLELYGVFSEEKTWKDDSVMTIHNNIADLVIIRAFSLSEFGDVRKVAAELCGRLHPQFLIPTLAYHMKSACQSRNALKLKACLFALCNSLVVRGVETAAHPLIAQIVKIIQSVLTRPPFDSDEVPKVKHGCIDCMALIFCAEIQSTNPESSAADADHTSVLTKAIQMLASESSTYHDLRSSQILRLCMASALVSAFQKVDKSSQAVLAQRTLPIISASIQAIADSDIRVACIQVLYSAVYHLKFSILPYSVDLLKLSVKVLKKGSDKERIAAAKLLASLMGSDDEIIERLSPGLVEAKSVLAGISMADSSSGELRQLSEKLLSCLASPLESLILEACKR